MDKYDAISLILWCQGVHNAPEFEDSKPSDLLRYYNNKQASEYTVEDMSLTELCEGGLYNQECKYGYLISGHAVYCHCKEDGTPTKCRYGWYGNGKDSDCPYFKPNNE